MTPLQPGQTVQFLRRFPFARSVLLGFRIRHHGRRSCSARLAFRVQEAATGKMAKLVVEMDGVEEHRFQRRPGQALVRLKDVRLAVFDDLFYFNLDAFARDGPPLLHEFRASDAFLAARAFSFEATPIEDSP